MNRFVIIFLLLSICYCKGALGQTSEIDSLKQLLSVEQQNDKKTELIMSLVNLTTNIDLNIGLEYARMGENELLLKEIHHREKTILR